MISILSEIENGPLADLILQPVWKGIFLSGKPEIQRAHTMCQGHMVCLDRIEHTAPDKRYQNGFLAPVSGRIIEGHCEITLVSLDNDDPISTFRTGEGFVFEKNSNSDHRLIIKPLTKFAYVLSVWGSVWSTNEKEGMLLDAERMHEIISRFSLEYSCDEEFCD